MFRKIVRAMIIIVGISIGPALTLAAYEILIFFGGANPYNWLPWVNSLVFVASGLITGLIAFTFSKRLAKVVHHATNQTEQELQKMPAGAVLFGSVGILIGLGIAFLISQLFRSLPGWIQIVLSIIFYLFLGYLGWRIGVRRRAELSRMFRRHRDGAETEKDEPSEAVQYTLPKVLDTSVLIDGRIRDVCATGFVEGTLVVPSFVLRELRHIADSADANRRQRGRRGLDVVHALQSDKSIRVVIEEQDYEDIAEVDEKLLRLTRQMHGKVVTNDYNLNKIAKVQHVEVLNINDLANAMKNVLLSGEQLEMQIMREGKEAGQGVAYLLDGTMVVVDGGKKYVGESVQVEVTSVLQTSAGRMVFAKIVAAG